MDIPRDYIFEGIRGDNDEEYRYWYADSSVFFITTFNNTLNYLNTRETGAYYERFEAIHVNDSLTLGGKDIKGRLMITYL